MSFSATSNFFEYFNIEKSFDIDLTRLHDAQVLLQAEFHPDRFVNGSDQEKRLSVQRASMINEAYDTLKDPVKRANYLLSLAGVEKDDNQTTNDSSFLMEQISFREEMGECRSNVAPLDCVEHLTSKLKLRFADFSDEFKQHFSAKEFTNAQESARKMMFVNKIISQLSDLLTEIEDDLM